MSVTLATTWRPHGEMPRFERLRPFLRELYGAITIAAPLESAGRGFDAQLAAMPEVRLLIDPGPFCGRHMAVAEAIRTGASAVHYADMDRLIRWAELRPDELRATVAQIETADCLILGRSEGAFATHPHCLQDTERIVNAVFGPHLGREMDLCSGSRAFSRRAAAYLLPLVDACGGFASDSEWAILLHRAGFSLRYIRVDGLDWETADRDQPHAADAERQRRLAQEYDADPAHWQARVQFAQNMIRAGLAALNKPIPPR